MSVACHDVQVGAAERFRDRLWRMCCPLVWWLGVLAVAGAGGCDRKSEPPPGMTLDQLPKTRIVSLAPALTQMVVDLGQSDLIVAVARNDSFVDRRKQTQSPDVAVVGDILDVNTEALLAANPSMVLVMPTKQGIPARLSDLAKAGRFQLLAYSPPHSVEEVGDILLDDQELIGQTSPDKTPSLGTALGVVVKAQKVKLDMMVKLQRMESLCRRDKPARVLMVIGVDPLMASGPKTTHDHLLRRIGAVNVLHESENRAPVLDREKVLELQPEVVLFFLPGAAALKPIDQDDRLASFRGLDIAAVRNNRIVLIDDATAMLPSSSMPRTAAIMAKAIYPEHASSLDRILAEDGAEKLDRQRKQNERPKLDMSRDVIPPTTPSTVR